MGAPKTGKPQEVLRSEQISPRLRALRNCAPINLIKEGKQRAMSFIVWGEGRPG